MTQGRKQLPDSIKKLQGSENITRLNNDKPNFDMLIELPEAPLTMNDEGLKVYESLGETLLDANILNGSNILSFISFCIEFGVYYAGSMEYQTVESRVEQTKYGSRVSSEHKVIQNAFSNWMKLAPEFGLTPASVSKIIAIKQQKKNPIDRLLDD